MQKRHFEAVARILHLFANGDQLPTVKAIAECLASEFATQNARFDRARFLRACGLEN